MLLPEALIDAARDNVAMQRSLGIDTDLIEPCPDLEWLNPADVAGVCYEPLGGYADPVRATEAYIAQFEALGGRVMTRTHVRALLGDGRAVTGVLTDDGPLAAGAIVNAAGPYSRFLAESVGLELPLRAIREQDTVFEARDGRPLPDTSISNAVDAMYLRPLGERRFVIGRGFPKDYEDVDPYNFKQTPDESFVMDVLDRAQRRFPTLDGARRIDAYTALYDVTPDWMPFVGAREGVSGYFDASGGSGHGFKLGPALGKELAAWVAFDQVSEDFRALSHDRVAAGQLFQGAYGGNRA
jgi:glycine/D-amino acid oxidase-like deaminating enzyme